MLYIFLSLASFKIVIGVFKIEQWNLVKVTFRQIYNSSEALSQRGKFDLYSFLFNDKITREDT
jgi:hypothetical protein